MALSHHLMNTYVCHQYARYMSPVVDLSYHAILSCIPRLMCSLSAYPSMLATTFVCDGRMDVWKPLIVGIGNYTDNCFYISAAKTHQLLLRSPQCLPLFNSYFHGI